MNLPTSLRAHILRASAAVLVSPSLEMMDGGTWKFRFVAREAEFENQKIFFIVHSSVVSRGPTRWIRVSIAPSAGSLCEIVGWKGANKARIR